MKKLFILITAMALLLTALTGSLAESWICPACGRENTGKFCPNDAQPSPAPVAEETYPGVTAAVKVGEAVFFGHYPQGSEKEVKPIEWLVTEVSGGSAMLVSRYLVKAMWVNVKSNDGYVTWEESELRKWLNGSFAEEAFNGEETARLVTMQVDNSRAQGNPERKGSGEPDTQEKVTALSWYEAETLLTEEQRIVAGTEYAQNGSLFVRTTTGTSYWWLRSPGSDGTMHAAVCPDGALGELGVNNVTSGVRPVIRVALDGAAAETPVKTAGASAVAPVAEQTPEATKPVAEPTPEPAAVPTEESAVAPEADDGIHITYFGGCTTLDALFYCADVALAEGEDPKQVGEEMVTVAEQNGILTAFMYIAENIAAVDNASYQKILPCVEGENGNRGINIWFASPYETLDDDGTTVYSTLEVSDALKELLADSTAEYCFKPAFWSESGFKQTFGTEYAKFKPAKARGGFACVIVKDSSQSNPDADWETDYQSKFSQALNDTVSDFMSALGDDAPVLTANPNLASQFWVFELTYPFYGNYGSGEPFVKGYNCTASLTVVDAATHKTVASVSATNRLANTISRWNNWIAQADVPTLSDCSDYPSLTTKVRNQLLKGRAAAQANQSITALNAGTVINGILANQSDSVTDAWQKAIYNAGAQEVTLSDGTVTFKLRSYDPKLSDIGKYADAEDATGWLMSALTNASAYDLEVSLPVEDGQITKKGLNTLKQTVTKAASTARTAFAGKDFSSALIAYLYPSPVEGKVTEASRLLEPTDAFTARMNEFELTRISSFDTWPAVFYGQKSQKLDVKGGPDAMVLSCVGADPAALLADAYTEVLDSQAFVALDERYSDNDLMTAFKLSVAGKGIAARQKGAYKYTLTIRLDELLAGKLPAEYTEYMNTFTYHDTESSLSSTVEKLPDIAALSMPKTGRLSGSSSGTSVTFKLSASGNATYIQMRNADTNEMTVSCFVAAGKSTSVKVPKGNYIIVWASGPYWYGEESLFGNLGTMNKSEATEIKGSNYRHTFTLEASENGDVGFSGADLSDFR